MADVKWTFFADTAAAERAIQRLEQQYFKLENAQTQLTRKSREGASAINMGLKAGVASVTSLATSYLALGNILTGVYTGEVRVLKAADDIANKFDVAVRKWRILTNQTELEGEESKKQIHEVAQRMGFSNDQGDAAARELTSAGFSAEEARGESLEALFKSLAANQKFDRDTDAGPLAKAAANYLNSQSLPLTGANLEKIGMMADKLGDVSTFNIADVEEIAKHGSGLAGKLTQEEQFAATTQLIKEGRAGSEAANSVEKIVLSLTGKGDKKKSAEALKEMGLTFEDVDMIGETGTQVFQSLRKAIAKVPAERQDTLLSKLFGVEHFSPAKTLITKADEVEGLTKGLDDREAFDADIAIATAGRSASGRRLEAIEEEQIEARAGKYSDEDVKKAIRIQQRNQGMNEYEIGLGQGMYNVARGLNVSQDAAIRMFGNDDKILKLLEESFKESQKQTGLLQETAKTRPKLNRNAQGEAATQ